MKISATLDVSENSGHRIFDLDDLGVTEIEWEQMGDLEKRAIIEQAVFDLREQPYWVLESFDEA